MRQGLSRLPLALVLGAFCLPLFIGLSSTDLDNDEAIYAYAVESILQTGDWMSPLSSPTTNVVFLEKPHLKFWLVALPIRLGLLPHDEFGLRFWDALFGAVAFVYVFLIGRRLAGPLCGVVSVLVLFAHRPLIFDHGLRTTNMEAALVLAYCGGIHHYLRWTNAGRWTGAHIAAVAAWFFFGFMTKFVAALFLPAVLAACALLIPSHRRHLVADRRRWALACAAAVTAIVPWFVYQHLAHGELLWRVMFGEHVYTRFTAYADSSHLQPWHFYVTRTYAALVEGDSAIWVGLGLTVLGVETIRRRQAEGVVILLWLMLPLVLISLGTSKLYHYFYPFLPPLALTAGYGAAWIARHAERLTQPLWARAGAIGPSISPRVRAAAAVIMVGAVILTVWTAIAGTIRVEAGGHLLFRSGSLLRPVVVALICAGLAIGPRTAVAAALAVMLSNVIPVPLSAYTRNLDLLSRSHRPLGRLAECLRRVADERRARGEIPPVVHAPVSTGFLHQYFYYLRGSGWLDPALDQKGDDERLRSALFVEGKAGPVAIDTAGYSAFLERAGRQDGLPAAVSQPGILVLLPGPYEVCKGTHVEPRQ